MSATTSDGGWAIRLHAAFDWVLWVMTVNILWYVFALAGGILFGSAPASVAAVSLTRRRLRGEVFPALGTFAREWRREFWRANAAVGPAFVVVTLLSASVAAMVAAGTVGTAFGIVTVVALILGVGVCAVAVPMYANYDLPLGAYLVTATRWALRNPAPVALLLVAAVAVVGASAVLPGIIPFLSVGAWITLDTALCLAFFAANDRRVAEAATSAAASSRSDAPARL